MLELAPSSVAVVRCLARRDVLDSLPAPAGAAACRVAPDELLLVGGEPAASLGAFAAHARDADPGGLALDHGDAFSAWTLAGPDTERAFARLSAIPLPAERPAFVQGTVAGVPGKALVEEERLLILVSSVLGHHLRERVLAACRDLDPREPAS